MNAYSLLLKNGEKKKGLLVQNDILKERVWKCGEDYVFECDVEEIIAGDGGISDQVRMAQAEEENVSFGIFD